MTNSLCHCTTNRKSGKDSEYENVETDEDDEAEREEEEIRKFEEEEKRILGKGNSAVFSFKGFTVGRTAS